MSGLLSRKAEGFRVSACLCCASTLPTCRAIGRTFQADGSPRKFTAATDEGIGAGKAIN